MDKNEQSCSNYGLMMENCYNFHPNWSDSNDQNDPFESALSSMVSSPSMTPLLSSSNGCGDGTMITELIGRLGSIVDGNNNSPSTNNNTSCYNTPLNSPPLSKFNLPSLMINANYPANLGSLNDDFVERAAKFSCFGNSNNFNQNIVSGKLSSVNYEDKTINNSINNGESRESSSLSEQNTGVELRCKPQNDANSRKRKSIPKAKLKNDKVENEETNAKRSKLDNELIKKKHVAGDCNNSKEKDNNNNDNHNSNNNNNGNNNNGIDSNNDSKAEPPKDYIHVRARRGQATDSHSLAERVRREKISERMKFLQDLVPGCNKVTGKATVLDEIINYVQSLQRQVEFLSMKLSTVNPRVEFNMDALLSKDMFQSLYHQIDQNSAQEFPFPYQSTQQIPMAFPNGAPNGFENPFSVSCMNGAEIRRNPNVPTPSINGYVDSLAQLPTLWEDDLQSIVQMGIVPNQTQSVPGTLLPNTHLKVEQ